MNEKRNETWTCEDLAKQLAETRKLMKDTFVQMRESSDKLDEKIDKLCGKVGGMDENTGHHAEQFFQDTLWETKTFGGQKYDYMIRNLKYGNGKDEGEFDIVLLNGKSVAIIEVKNRIHPKFVKEMAEKKIAKFRKVFPVYQKHNVYLGIAGFSFSDAVREKAKEYGIGIIKQVGQSIEIEADKLKAY